MKHAGATEIGNVVVELGDRIAAAARQYAHDKIAPLARYAPSRPSSLTSGWPSTVRA